MSVCSYPGPFVGAVLALALASTPVPAQSIPSRAPVERADLTALGREYSLRIVVRKSTFPARVGLGAIEAREATVDQIAAYAPILVFEWKLYPPDLIKQARLKRLVLCQGLSYAGQRRAAVPSFADDTLYLDVVLGSYSQSYVRRVIHHEFFHIIDLRDDGQLYRDDTWARLNKPGFHYGRGGKNAQNDSRMSLATAATPGFLNRYSMTGVEEDKAELFAYLMVDPKYVDERAAKDPILRAKVRRMEELLVKFCPAMGPKFWAHVRLVSRLRLSR